MAHGEKNQIRINNAHKSNRFGSNLHYIPLQDLERLFEVIGNPEHKLMFRLIYELGCRVGEFVRVRLHHLDFQNNSIFFPAENTKSKRSRTSYISPTLMIDLKRYLKRKRLIVRTGDPKDLEAFLFQSRVPCKRQDKGTSENRIRRLFSHYIRKAGLEQVYGHDKLGRSLHLYTVHSLRHSHIMHAKHIWKIKDSVVAKQVGHVSLVAMSAYDQPTEEMVKEAYQNITRKGGERLKR